MTLTLQKIKDCNPDQDEWNKLTKSVGDNLATELSIGDVLISNDLNDAVFPVITLGNLINKALAQFNAINTPTS